MDSLPRPRPDVPHANKLCDNYDLMHRHLLKSMNSFAIVLSILLTTSYSGFLQPPRPLSTYSALSASQKLFIYLNGFSFFLSVTGLLFFASSSFTPLLSLDSTGSALTEAKMRLQLLANLLPKFFYMIFFFGVSLSSCVLAYTCASFVTVASTWNERLPVVITTSLGGLIFLQALWVCSLDTFQLIDGSIRQNEQLWNAMKRGTWFGQWFGRYVDFLCADLQPKSQGREDSDENEHLRAARTTPTPVDSIEITQR